MEQMSYREWSQQAGTKPLVWPKLEPRILVHVRCIPGVYAQHEAKIEDGERFAEISINASRLRYPSPLNDGHPTVECREWLTDAVAETVRRDGHKRCIFWPDDSVTLFNENCEPYLRQPSNDHEAQHG